MTKERFDIHQHITDKIVSAIERGAGEFRLPWHRGTGNIMRPFNIASKKAYRGVNVVALWAYAEASGYSSGTWGTYRQWVEAGAQVRKGEKAAFVVFYKELEIAAETGEAETETRLFGRATPVFAAEQVDGYQPPSDRRARRHHDADRAGRGLRRRDRGTDRPRRNPRLLPPLHGQHSASPRVELS